MTTDGNGGDGNGYVDQVRANTRSYIRELLDEQAELRRQLDELRADLERRDREQQAMRRHERRFADIEQQNANLAALYAACYQLHTPRRDEVLRAIQEIVINLIGSEELAVLGIGHGGALRPLAHMGVDPDALRALTTDTGLIARAFAEGGPVAQTAEPAEPDRITACVPLLVGGRRVGVIVVFRLLPQKPRLEPFDHELLGLLATHAATALFCSELYEREGLAA
jgi:GAF domain-containing protein